MVRTADGRFQIGIKTASDRWLWFDVYMPPRLAVDANRDGQIAFSSADATSTNAPYRFWLNYDDDTSNSLVAWWSDPDPEYYPARRAD